MYGFFVVVYLYSCNEVLTEIYVFWWIPIVATKFYNKLMFFSIRTVSMMF